MSEQIIKGQRVIDMSDAEKASIDAEMNRSPWLDLLESVREDQLAQAERQKTINSYESAFQMRDWDTVEAMQSEYPWLRVITQEEYEIALAAYEAAST